MRKKNFKTIALVFAAAAMMTACGPEKTAETTAQQVPSETVESVAETKAPETEVKDEVTDETETMAELVPAETVETEAGEQPVQKEAEQQSATLDNLLALLGMSDADTADQFGGGEENWTEDKKFYIGRNYQITLFDEQYSMHTSCDDSKKVNAVSVWLSEGNEEVPKEEAELWAERITEATGVEPTHNDKASEGGSISWKWKLDGKFITMYWMKDNLSVNMNPAVGELK